MLRVAYHDAIQTKSGFHSSSEKQSCVPSNNAESVDPRLNEIRLIKKGTSSFLSTVLCVEILVYSTNLGNKFLKFFPNFQKTIFFLSLRKQNEFFVLVEFRPYLLLTNEEKQEKKKRSCYLIQSGGSILFLE